MRVTFNTVQAVRVNAIVANSELPTQRIEDAAKFMQLYEKVQLTDSECERMGYKVAGAVVFWERDIPVEREFTEEEIAVLIRLLRNPPAEYKWKVKEGHILNGILRALGQKEIEG